MSTVVNSIPKVERKTLYPYDLWFNGETHRLVRGEDFKVEPASFRGALYGRKTDLNEKNPTNQIGLTVQFRTEKGQTVAYVQKIAPKVRKTKAAKPVETETAKAETKPKATPAKKSVAPKPKA